MGDVKSIDDDEEEEAVEPSLPVTGGVLAPFRDLGSSRARASARTAKSPASCRHSSVVGVMTIPGSCVKSLAKPESSLRPPTVPRLLDALLLDRAGSATGGASEFQAPVYPVRPSPLVVELIVLMPKPAPGENNE